MCFDASATTEDVAATSMHGSAMSIDTLEAFPDRTMARQDTDRLFNVTSGAVDDCRRDVRAVGEAVL